RYRRPALGSQLDSLEPVLRRLVEEWPQIKAPRVAEILRLEHGFGGSERLVREHLRRLRPSRVRPAQRTGYRPAQVLQFDWAEMPRGRASPGGSGASTRSSRRCPIRAPRARISALIS